MERGQAAGDEIFQRFDARTGGCFVTDFSTVAFLLHTVSQSEGLPRSLNCRRSSLVHFSHASLCAFLHFLNINPIHVNNPTKRRHHYEFVNSPYLYNLEYWLLNHSSSRVSERRSESSACRLGCQTSIRATKSNQSELSLWAKQSFSIICLADEEQQRCVCLCSGTFSAALESGFTL